MSKPTKLIRIDLETDRRINDLAIKASNAEGNVVSKLETVRRTFNIPTLPNVIEEDARGKRRLK